MPGRNGKSSSHTPSASTSMSAMEAKQVSDRIDEELRVEREKIRRRRAQRRDVKVLLLGQAESGKSTLQKQFQLYYASHSLERERPRWAPVVHLNVVRAVRIILEELEWDQRERDLAAREADTRARRLAKGKGKAAEYDEDSSNGGGATSPNGGGMSGANTPVSPRSRPLPTPWAPAWGEELGELRRLLLPLVALEDALASELSGGVAIANPAGRVGAYVRAGWQTLLVSSTSASPIPQPTTSDNRIALVASRTLSSVVESVVKLWYHPAVRGLMKNKRLPLEDSAGYFMDAIYRVAEDRYEPSTEDILNVRLQTLGVIEHRFDINMGGSSVTWSLYDVGGARGKRHTWVPFFDDATAIIFLAPMSAFDQYLEEDPKVNRIDDSLQLFTAICSNSLLAKVHLVLLLNKADLLKGKLKDGLRVKKYITSYGDRPNSYEDVSEYFRAHFVQVHRRNDKSRRALYVHFTSMLDIKATQRIIVNVGEAIIRDFINETGLT